MDHDDFVTGVMNSFAKEQAANLVRQFLQWAGLGDDPTSTEIQVALVRAYLGALILLKERGADTSNHALFGSVAEEVFQRLGIPEPNIL